MKLGLTNVAEDFYKVVNVSTIEQLIKLTGKYDNPIIFEKNPYYNTDYDEIPRKYRNCEYALEIYDNYRE